MQVVTVTTHKELFHLELWLRAAKHLALDIEDTGAIESDPRLVSVAVTADGETAYVLAGDMQLPGGPPPFGRANLKALLEGLEWTMHNGYHDRLMMRRFGIELTLKHDTMAMAYLLNQSDPKAKTSRKGLEYLAGEILGADAYKDVDYKNILDEPWDKVATMNARDAGYTWQLFRPLADRLNAQPALSRIYQKLLMPAVNALIEVTENGVPVDTERLSALTEELQTTQTEQLAWLQANTPEPDPERYPKGWPKHKELGKAFNPGSSDQVAHILFDIRKLPPIELTGTGKASTNADVLLQLAILKPDPWLDNLLAYRKTCTALNSFLLKWPTLWDEKQWLHPKYKPLHVVTGRLSSEAPNIQNIPHEARFRDCFGGVQGLTWVKADYSQIELRVAAWVAGEETMLEAYESHQDLHRLTARLVLGDSSDAARYAAKTLNFGLLYGAGPATLQRIARQDYGLHFTEGQARRHREEFFRAYPGLVHWHQRMREYIVANRTAVSPLGRVRQLPDARFWRFEDEDLRKKAAAAVREGINHPVQSFASDLLLMSMLRVRPIVEKYGARMICEVHDEMDFLVPDASVRAFGFEVKEMMEDVSWLSDFGIKMGVPVVAEITAGTHWGTQKEIT